MFSISRMVSVAVVICIISSKYLPSQGVLERKDRSFRRRSVLPKFRYEVDMEIRAADEIEEAAFDPKSIVVLPENIYIWRESSGGFIPRDEDPGECHSVGDYIYLHDKTSVTFYLPGKERISDVFRLIRGKLFGRC